jgi:hypothetical protein
MYYFFFKNSFKIYIPRKFTNNDIVLLLTLHWLDARVSKTVLNLISN